jgi:hypothetical protein
VVSEVARQVNPDSAELVDGAIRLRNDEMITRDYYVEAQHDGWEGSCEVASVHHQLPLLFSKG